MKNVLNVLEIRLLSKISTKYFEKGGIVGG